VQAAANRDGRLKKRGKMRIVFHFWAKVVLRSLRITWVFIKDHVATGLILVLAFIIASYLAATGIINQAVVQGYVSDVNSWGRFFAGLALAAMFWFLINMVYQPAKMHDELGGFSALKLRIEIVCYPPRYSEAWVSIIIHNDHSRIPIERCYAYLKSATSEKDNTSPLKRTGEKLSWSSANLPLYGEQEIPPNDSRAVDAIRTIHSENRIMFTIQEEKELYKDKASVGNYQVICGVTGIFGGKRFDEVRAIRVTYSGEMNLSCEAA
jgi:hypothetical protein